jgi:hypothetical protein
MKVRFNELQRKACINATRCLQAVVVVTLNRDPLGETWINRAAHLMKYIGPEAINLSDADLTPEEAVTLAKALDVMHYVWTFSKELPLSREERNKVLNSVRQCKSAIQ